MLAGKMQFHLVNNTGQTLDTNGIGPITVAFKFWKYGATGALEYAPTETTLTYSGADVTNGSDALLGEVDNSSTLYLGAHGEFQCISPASADGTIDLYMEWATDGGTDYPSEATSAGIEEDLTYVTSCVMGASETKVKTFEL